MTAFDRPVPGEPAFGDPSLARRWRAAHRGVQDHLLQVIAESPWSDGLILRGSLPLRAWLGAAAREPGDLDWIVLEHPAESFVDPLDPFPYIDGLDTVQLWPEAAHGAGAPEFWTDGEHHHTGGTRPALAPEGLHWMTAEDIGPAPGPEERVVAAMSDGPPPPEGICVDPAAVRADGVWLYREYETPGVRVVIPWQADGLPPGDLRMDFALEERLPESPVWTACPRGDGGPPVPVRTAGPGLSLAWKLLWLAEDFRACGRSAAKDLYDAVLLAEHPDTRLPTRLLHSVLGPSAARVTPEAVRDWSVDWTEFRAGHPWVADDADLLRERLAAALAHLPQAGERRRSLRSGTAESRPYG